MDVNEIGAENYYYSKLWEYWSDKCIAGEITEDQMEDKLDRYEEMSTRQRKAAWKRLKHKEQGR